jgi:hypothetical protein
VIEELPGNHRHALARRGDRVDRAACDAQAGTPAGKYTFQIQATGQTVLAGQWDGVYRLTGRGWQRSASGLPRQLAVTEMVMWRDRVVIDSSTLPPARATQ